MYYKDMKIWQKSMDLVEETYTITSLLPKEEQYGLVSQMRRAAVSIPSNIAEGQSRHTVREYINFLSFAGGSKSELDTQLEICVRLGFLDTTQITKAQQLCDEIGKMLYVLISRLREKGNA